ncbi:MAG: class I SAM-dependent methyltransferase [Gemmatimonadaceae bacterium]|nr:class I SAM-dependent methyltransferase [Gemmatimonadaceae bacterium]
MTTDSYVHSHKDPGKGKQYDSFYATDPWHVYLWGREQAVLRQLLRDQFGDRPIDLLDFACGTGRITSALEPHVRSAVGVDVSPSMLAQAREKLQRTELVEGNLLEGDLLAGRRFNLITAFRFFVNAEPGLRLAAIKALAPLLTEDGCLVFNNHQNLGSAYIQITKAYARLKGFKFANTLSIAECETLCAAAGLRITRIYPVAMFHLPRLHFPPAVYRAADAVGAWSPAFARHAECPIIVARRT